MAFNAALTSDHLLSSKSADVLRRVTQLRQHLIGVLTQQRGSRHVSRAVAHLDRITHREVPAPGRMVNLYDGTAGPQRGLLGKLFHGQDRTAWDVVLVQKFHGLELRFGDCPRLNGSEYFIEPGQARVRRRVVGMSDPLLLAYYLADLLPHRRLGNEVEIGVGFVLPSLALDDSSPLSSSPVIPSAGLCAPELPLG